VPVKARYSGKELQDWASRPALRSRYRRASFGEQLKAMRMCLCWGGWSRSHRVFEAYWGADQDISQEPVLREICRSLGLDADALLARRPTTQSRRSCAQHRRGDGPRWLRLPAPSSSAGTDMYFGNDAAVVRAPSWSGRGLRRQTPSSDFAEPSRSS